MTQQDCIFCKIIAGQIPATIITQNEQVLVIADKFPKASIHYLIIPKKHIKDINSLSDDDGALMGHTVLMARQLSETIPAPHSFRLVSNNGPGSGQSVFHIHIHFLVGAITGSL